MEERYGYLKDQKNDVETAQRNGVSDPGDHQEMEAIFRREFARIQAAFSPDLRGPLWRWAGDLVPGGRDGRAPLRH